MPAAAKAKKPPAGKPTEVASIAPATPLGECPPIPLEKIRWRVDSKPSNGRARFISYIDARVAGEALDAWVGPLGWDVKFEEGMVAGNPVLWCHLTITEGDRSVVRSDLATFSEGRGEDQAKRVETGVKGLVSGAFKRAAAQAGVGRNVYLLPEVWAPVRVTTGRNNKEVAYPNDQTQPAILRKLKDAGFEMDGSLALDAAPANESDTAAEEQAAPATPPAAPAEVDWTRDAKSKIYVAAGHDADAGAAAYAEALSLEGLQEPLNEAGAANVVEAAILWLGTDTEPVQDARPTT